TVADLHIGTYRHSYLLSQLLPRAEIFSVDCWSGESAEAAVQDVRDIEPVPIGEPRIRPFRAHEFSVPLPDSSCDVVVFGFGTHEIPTGGPREKIFTEAARILRPGGKALLFEHGQDLHNFVIFGPVIHHVTTREDWRATMQSYFTEVSYARSSVA